MPDIPNKGRILRLLQYLYLNTDEEHAATTQDLIDALAETGFKANRKTVKDDIDVMNNMGSDIVINVSSGNSFFLRDRTFELPELKLLIDAVSSSRFISAEKSQQLIDKITTLASVNQRDQLIQRIYTKDRIKPTGSKIYYVVDQLSVAIQEGKQIQFKYTEYNADKQKVYRNDGEVYINSPYGLFWSDDFYYLIGHSEKRKKVVTFRVDRIEGLTILDAPIIPEPDDFEITDFVRKVFEMYDGQETEVELICDNCLMKNVIDRFGEDIKTEKISEIQFRAFVPVSASKTFYSWVFTFAGQMKIAGPETIKNEYMEMLKKAME